jgi:hypothetical protein
MKNKENGKPVSELEPEHPQGELHKQVVVTVSLLRKFTE